MRALGFTPRFCCLFIASAHHTCPHHNTTLSVVHLINVLGPRDYAVSNCPMSGLANQDPCVRATPFGPDVLLVVVLTNQLASTTPAPQYHSSRPSPQAIVNPYVCSQGWRSSLILMRCVTARVQARTRVHPATNIAAKRLPTLSVHEATTESGSNGMGGEMKGREWPVCPA